MRGYFLKKLSCKRIQCSWDTFHSGFANVCKKCIFTVCNTVARERWKGRTKARGKGSTWQRRDHCSSWELERHFGNNPKINKDTIKVSPWSCHCVVTVRIISGCWNLQCIGSCEDHPPHDLPVELQTPLKEQPSKQNPPKENPCSKPPKHKEPKQNPVAEIIPGQQQLWH